MSKDLILMNGLGIAPSELVRAGTIAIMLHGGEVQIVPAEVLRATVERIGSEKVEGLTMAPSDFEKLHAVIERQTQNNDGSSEDAEASAQSAALDDVFRLP